MKNLAILFIAFLFLQFTSFSQEGWFYQNPAPPGNTLNSVKFLNSNTGWAVGDAGQVMLTTNGGDNWYNPTSDNRGFLRSVDFVDENNGWAVGQNGTILHTSNGGVTFVEEEKSNEILTDYSLTQNFPNPFNPSTKIRYSVPQTLTKVVLKVYDILGREIETLINEKKLTGTYEITWYAQGLPSGIYFYRLQTGNFIETKKMVLMK